MTHTQSDSLTELRTILNQFIVYGQKQQPFVCARCGAQADDNTKNFCWCTDRDTSNGADSPTWIENINYPRFAEARTKALSAIQAHIDKLLIEARLDELQRLKKIDCFNEGYSMDVRPSRHLSFRLEQLKEKL